MYGKSLMGEVIEQTINESSQKVLADYNLRVAATQPDLKPESDMDKVFDGHRRPGLRDSAVEVMPDFEPIDPTTLKLQRSRSTRPTDKEAGRGDRRAGQGQQHL